MLSNYFKSHLRPWVDNPRGNLMVVFYRIANIASRGRRKSRWHNLWAVPLLVIYRLANELVFHYEIPASTQIGPGLFIDHGYGIVINKNTVIGKNLRLKHRVTIGCKTLDDGSQGKSPIIGDNVDIGAHAIILGDIRIGNNVKIGAGAVVTRSVPDKCVVVAQYTQSIRAIDCPSDKV